MRVAIISLLLAVCANASAAPMPTFDDAPLRAIQFVDKNDEVIHAEIASLQVLTQFGDHACEDKILRIFLGICDVYHVHRPIGEAPKGQVRHSAIVGHEPCATRGQIRQAVSHFSNRGRMMRTPCVAIRIFNLAQYFTKPCVEIGKRKDAVHP